MVSKTSLPVVFVSNRVFIKIVAELGSRRTPRVEINIMYKNDESVKINHCLGESRII